MPDHRYDQRLQYTAITDDVAAVECSRDQFIGTIWQISWLANFCAASQSIEKGFMPRIVDHDQRRAELAKAARAIVATEGIEALTIARVAAATGYSSGVVNHYFANKRQMLLYMYTSTVEQVQARLKAQLARSPLNLDACLKAFLPMNEEQQHEWLLWFAFWGMAITDLEFQMAQRRGLRGAQDLLLGIFQEQARHGLLPADADCDFLTHHCIALINGIAVQAVFDLQEWPPRRQLSFIKKALALI